MHGRCLLGIYQLVWVVLDEIEWKPRIVQDCPRVQVHIATYKRVSVFGSLSGRVWLEACSSISRGSSTYLSTNPVADRRSVVLQFVLHAASNMISDACLIVAGGENGISKLPIAYSMTRISSQSRWIDILPIRVPAVGCGQTRRHERPGNRYTSWATSTRICSDLLPIISLSTY